MVIVSCTTKFHSYDLAEQLAKNELLTSLYTSFHSQKNRIFSSFHHRKDNENIPVENIKTLLPIAIGLKLAPKFEYEFNELFDMYVSQVLSKTNKNFQIFIGWSGMSLHTIKKIKKQKKIVILERGSSHILYQNKILNQEYKKQLGIDYKINVRVIEKELQEYQEADFISVPSLFVKNSFIDYGVPENKLFYNPYGVSNLFNNINIAKKFDDKFRILYLGHMGVRKGLIYMFEALNKLNIPDDDFEVWFIGGLSDELRPIFEKHKKKNWIHFGFIEHNLLPSYISKCDVGIQPSIEEGLSRVIPQMLACGLPVIASKNTGGEDVIEDQLSGFIIPIRDSDIIKFHIEALFYDKNKLEYMQKQAAQTAFNKLEWTHYGDRYTNFIKTLLDN